MDNKNKTKGPPRTKRSVCPPEQVLCIRCNHTYPANQIAHRTADGAARGVCLGCAQAADTRTWWTAPRTPKP